MAADPILDRLVAVRQRLTDIVTGDWMPPVAQPYVSASKPHRYDRCPHGQTRREGCIACTDAELERIMAALDEAISLAIVEGPCSPSSCSATG